MTVEMAFDSWGFPETIDRTVTGHDSCEQWVYANTYLYFENGVLQVGKIGRTH